MFKMTRRAMLMSDTGTNAGSGEPGDAGKQEAGQQEGEKNNEQNNDDKFEEIWQTPTEDPAKQPQQQPQAPAQQSGPSSEEVFTSYIDKLELTKGIDLAEISEELNQGKTEGLGKAFNAVAGKTYRQAMVDMSKIIDQKVSAGIEAAVQKSSNAVQGNMAVSQMNTAMAFTKNPAIAPVAGAVLSQLIKKGKSVDDAVEGVRAFFQNTSKISAKELGLHNAPAGRPGNKSFNGAGDIGGDDEEIDWLETMGV